MRSYCLSKMETCTSVTKHYEAHSFEADTYFLPLRNYNFKDKTCSLKNLTELGIHNLYASMLSA